MNCMLKIVSKNVCRYVCRRVCRRTSYNSLKYNIISHSIFLQQISKAILVGTSVYVAVGRVHRTALQIKKRLYQKLLVVGQNLGGGGSIFFPFLFRFQTIQEFLNFFLTDQTQPTPPTPHKFLGDIARGRMTQLHQQGVSYGGDN